MPGPDLPPAAAPMTTHALLARWPTGAQKVELLHGVLVFVGDFDERAARSGGAGSGTSE
ncbi:hypothetical protein ACJ6WF_48260 [Streptomyces sp. MMS24-I2-30]|uniref:hypothetical protein n=1 Tax=Streptomyces sp. MMS24-I2-30 TaxID=3351564 RepID=UPI003896A1F2